MKRQKQRKRKEVFYMVTQISHNRIFKGDIIRLVYQQRFQHLSFKPQLFQQ
ncbi:hypothetical protein O3M35_011738 [Rhynocoris fuscipes]|uniref:Uncharacterized protein n=1 Tax=Rhynocoris fuscipes TaxID=488301 RepID=A0AAW1D2L9_9HEMI